MNDFVLIPRQDGSAIGFNWSHVVSIRFLPEFVTGEDAWNDEGIPVGTVVRASLTVYFAAVAATAPGEMTFTARDAENIYSAYCRMATAW